MGLHDTIIIAIIGVFAAAFGGNGFWQWIATRSHKMTPYERLSMAQGRDRLNFLCKKHLKQGYIPDDEYDSFKEMGDAYIAAKGNTRVKKLFEDAMKLPVKVDD